MTQSVMTMGTTKSGLPTVWECGGGLSNTGKSQIIATGNGLPKKPVYVNRRGTLACEEHALFVVHEGDIIITANHHRKDFEIVISIVQKIEPAGAAFRATLVSIYEYSKGEWSQPLPETMNAAVSAAMAKATCFHCREPHFYKEDLPATKEESDVTDS